MPAPWIVADLQAAVRPEFSPSLRKRGQAGVPGWSCRPYPNSLALEQEKEMAFVKGSPVLSEIDQALKVRACLGFITGAVPALQPIVHSDLFADEDKDDTSLLFHKYSVFCSS